ncbi:MAG: hypothetical protein KBD53_05590 [Candidatus Omnitrophica bacterium]|nr:hypothetical protein [Candidatus Omnitrophota bacterium]
MKKIFLIILILTVISGCTWLNILAPIPSPEDVQKAKNFVGEKRNTARVYMGKSKNEVRQDWGKPDFEEINAAYCENPDLGCSCPNLVCQPGINYHEERWRYTEKDKEGFGKWTYYSVDFIFKNGLVIETK